MFKFRLTSEESPLTKMPPPQYVSIEFKIWDDDFKGAAAEIFQGAAALQLAGYTRFKLTLQNFYDTRFAPFGSGSGPFGDAAVDFEYGHNWRSIDQLYSLARFFTHTPRNISSKIDMLWFDLHAALDDKYVRS